MSICQRQGLSASSIILLLFNYYIYINTTSSTIYDFPEEKKHFYRDKVKSMFYHAYNGYLEHAYPKDELSPITCTGKDTWGSYSLTLVDSLDMLLILDNSTEFQRVSELLFSHLDVDRNMNISVFETNIRIIGGLLSAHMLSSHAKDMTLPDGWPCSGPFLNLAEKFAQKLLPAFNTNTGMPYGTVNLKYGVNILETPITCVAGIGTFILEFGTLSRLTGNPHYERIALKALDSLSASRSKLGLLGNHIDVQTGIFTATDSGIGAGVDSYFEYLVKGSLLFQRPNLMKQFYELEEAINKHVRKEDHFMWVDKDKATVSLPIFQSLEAFWPGLLTLIGKVEDAVRIMASYGQIIRHLGVPPEFYNLPNREPVQRRMAYPLRPEVPESLMYLYRATKDPSYLQMAAGIVDVIDQLARTKCGFATVRDVTTFTLEDRMESFFLAETTKYLYLIFDEDNFIHNDGRSAKLIETTDGPCVIEAGGWIFNTEAHPLDPGIIYCCSQKRNKDRAMLQEFEENIDILSLIGQFVEFEQTDEDEGNVSSSFVDKIDTGINNPLEGDTVKQAILGDNIDINEKMHMPENSKMMPRPMEVISNKILEIFKNSEIKFEFSSKNMMQTAERNQPELKSTSTSTTKYFLCMDCCTWLDQPGTGMNSKSFLFAIQRNQSLFDYIEGPVCWEWEYPNDDIASDYSNQIPDVSSLQPYSQKMDAVKEFSLRKFKYYTTRTRESETDEMNFTLLTSPGLSFDQNFIGIGQIV